MLLELVAFGALIAAVGAIVLALQGGGKFTALQTEIDGLRRRVDEAEKSQRAAEQKAEAAAAALREKVSSEVDGLRAQFDRYKNVFNAPTPRPPGRGASDADYAPGSFAGE
ncbi:MAG: hypothetical protein JSR82_21585 [Verrucomicrobia bacterium]|nr:hypothetical protein [Verrucomicrobiota bacterium]